MTLCWEYIMYSIPFRRTWVRMDNLMERIAILSYFTLASFCQGFLKCHPHPLNELLLPSGCQHLDRVHSPKPKGKFLGVLGLLFLRECFLILNKCIYFHTHALQVTECSAAQPALVFLELTLWGDLITSNGRNKSQG